MNVRMKRKPIPGMDDMQVKASVDAALGLDNLNRPISQDFQDFSKTLQPGTVGNTQTSKTSKTLGDTTGKQPTVGSVNYECVPATDVDIEAPEWVEIDGTKWLVRKGVTMLVGAKRSGKSTETLYLAARATASGLNVVIAAQEDDYGIVRARLEAMNADLSHVHFFRKNRVVEVGDGDSRHRRTVKVNFDYRDTNGITKQAGLCNADLVIIDPITALAKGDWNRQDAADCIVPLTAWAQDMNAAVLAVMHPHQNPRDVNTAATGTDQWLAKSRSHLAMAPLPGDDLHAVVQQVTQSYEGTSNRLVSFAKKDMTDRNGKPFTVRYVTGMEPTDQTVQEIYDLDAQSLAAPTDPDEKGDIAVWLHDTIKGMGCHVFTTDLQKKAKDEKGWSAANLRASYRSAGIGQTKQSCKRPRSILYLNDLAEYEKADRNKGISPEQLARQWGDPNNSPRESLKV